ncbi:MAG: putative cytosol aminopeptidase [marine bacterium B5-7]|nr:MAG: putative cytosol aminopeptidase [marine bacterium B5-7]
MKYSVKSSNPLTHASGCLAVTVYTDGSIGDVAKSVDQATGGVITAAVKRGDIKGKVGESLMIPLIDGIRAHRLLLLGAGDKADECSLVNIKKIGAKLANTLEKSGAADAAVSIEGLNIANRSLADSVTILIEAMEYAAYRFDQLKQKKSSASLKAVTLLCDSRSQANIAQTGVNRGEAIAGGVRLARDLGNLPGNICTPSYLASEARKMQKSHSLKVTVLDEGRMEKLGMGSLLSVSRGSREPAKLIIMEYQGAAKSKAPIVLVGKGLTFDAGGISLKPAPAMDEMKYDMCGGASVLGTLKAVAELGLKINVVGIVPASENLPDGAANKPGDIVTSMAGKTIEILNTDAEGRLILCDALTYARRFKPAAIIDIATLTGACVIALGAHPSGLFSQDDALAEEILEAGNQSGDRAWRMPLWDDYQKQLDSPFADIANIGGKGGGAVIAACFLARFTEDLTWAHLDIAGTAWTQGKNKSATGRPVALLTRFILSRCQ